MLKDDSVTIHQRNLRVLAVEIYKISHKLFPKFMWDLVEEINTKYQTMSSYNIDINDNSKIECTKKSNYRAQMTNTISFGLQSFRGLGLKIWALIPNESKRIQS